MRRRAPRCRSLRLLSLALAVAALGCREDAESPTAPSLGPELATAKSGALSFRQVSAGRFHTCGLTVNHAAYCWGDNFWGQLGDGTTTQRLTPVAVAGGLRFRQLSAGQSQTCGVTTDNVAYCWGTGALGNPTITASATPVPVAGGLSFRQVTSPSNSCGVTIGNLAYCWGGNAAGQLGDGTTNPSPTPVLVAGGLHFREVSGGVAHFCGVTTGNQAYCWGLNTFGPLGDGTSGNFRTVPVAVAGGLRFGEVRADAQHTCGIATDNAAYCWGLNVFGEAGDGTSDNFRPAPVAVVGGLRFRELTLGEQHTCGLVTGGRAFCWGGDFNFQLGTPTPGDGTTPVAVAGGLRFHQLSAGGDHTCAVSTGNAAYCWGTGFSGELGNGTTDPSQTPTPVAAPAP